MSYLNSPTAIERAFTLARFGKCSNVHDIRQQLKGEGYSVEQITGPSLLCQLRELIRSTQTER